MPVYNSSVGIFMIPRLRIGQDSSVEHPLAGRIVRRYTVSNTIAMDVHSSGMFVFNFSNDCPTRLVSEVPSEIFEMLNAFLFLLSVNEVHKPIMSSVLRSELVLWPDGFGLPNVATDNHLFSLLETQRLESNGMVLKKKKTRMTSVHLAKIAATVKRLSRVSGHKQAVELLAMLGRAKRMLADQEHGSALGLAWMVSESSVAELWSRHLLSPEVLMGLTGTAAESRKGFLKDTRSFTTSVRSEVLRTANKLPADLLKRMNAIRKIRNNWIHDRETVSEGQAIDAIQVGLESVKFTFEMRLH